MTGWWARVLVGLLWSVGTAGVALGAPAALPIGEIRIVSHEVFDEPDRGGSTPYRIANHLHVRTRELVVRRELLFETGELLDRELVEQTERNLRALPFLRDARVETTAVDGDGDDRPERIDVTVLTWDAWSLAPRFDFRQVQNRTVWEAGVSEKNLLGFGKAITVTHRTNLDRTSDRVAYTDPQLVGSNVSMVASAAHLSDGDEQYLTFDRGYLSLRDPWAWSAGAGSFRRTAPVFEDGVEIERIPHWGQWAEIEASRAVRRGDRNAVRLHGAYRLREGRVGPEGRDFGIAEVGVRSVAHRFVRVTHVNRFERAEDLNLGGEWFGVVGVSTPALGRSERRTVFLSAGHARGMVLGPDHVLIAEGRFDGRRETRAWRNTIATMRLRYLRKPAPRRARVGRVTYRHGHNLDPEVQLLLGAETGLRGYPVRQFSGNRSLLLTAEERWFLADDVWQVVSLGVAAFVDSGFVWPSARPVDLADLKTSAGVSLLLGSNRLSTRGGIRIDLGYGFNRLEETSRWVLAAGTDLEF